VALQDLQMFTMQRSQVQQLIYLLFIHPTQLLALLQLELVQAHPEIPKLDLIHLQSVYQEEQLILDILLQQVELVP